jgi:hypothetical protein
MKTSQTKLAMERENARKSNTRKRVAVWALAPLFTCAAFVNMLACPGTLENPERFAVAVPQGANPTDVCAGTEALLNARCATSGCHSATDKIAGFDLAGSNLRARLSGQKGQSGALLIDPSSAQNSALYNKCTDTPKSGSRMPLGGKNLDAPELACLAFYLEGKVTVSQTDAGPGRADASVAAETSNGLVGAFVAIGHAGRTTLSCDDGKTWIANRSDDDGLRCFDSPATDCDHNGKAGRGISAAGGFLIANFGWGAPGNIRRSEDGVTWTEVNQGTNFGSMVFGQGKLFAASGTGRISSDWGMTWQNAGTFDTSSRRGGFGGTGAGVFLVVGDGTVHISPDAQAWQLSSAPASCARDIQWAGGIASNGQSIVLLNGDGASCRTTDNGQTWTTTSLPGTISGRLLWNGTHYISWGSSTSSEARVFRSSDGATWQSEPTTVTRTQGGSGTSNGPPIGPVAFAANGSGGTYVAANDGWQQWYDKQRFYRSVDGIRWDELPAGTYAPSHPMTHIISANIKKSALCN